VGPEKQSVLSKYPLQLNSLQRSFTVGKNYTDSTKLMQNAGLICLLLMIQYSAILHATKSTL